MQTLSDSHKLMAADGCTPPPDSQLRLVMLPHAHVPRACPVVQAKDHAAARSAKTRLFAEMVATSYVLHCFPPGGQPPTSDHSHIFMGHPRRTAAEERFLRRVGLWRLRESWKGTPTDSAMCDLGSTAGGGSDAPGGATQGTSSIEASAGDRAVSRPKRRHKRGRKPREPET